MLSSLKVKYVQSLKEIAIDIPGQQVANEHVLDVKSNFFLCRQSLWTMLPLILMGSSIFVSWILTRYLLKLCK